jgi:polyhydroxybutyrate depolymerase
MTLQTQRVADDVVLESYGDCEDGADVQLYVVEGGGHVWPGGRIDVPGLGYTTHSVSATELSWQFFAAHPK